MKTLLGIGLFLLVLASVHAGVGYLFETAKPGYAMRLCSDQRQLAQVDDVNSLCQRGGMK